MDKQVNFFDLSFKELSDLLSSWGQPSFRAKQIWELVYRHLQTDPLLFSNQPIEFRAKLKESLEFSHLQEIELLTSKDHQTIKNLYKLPSGSLIETVLMRYDRRETVCISTQSGCAMGCEFCATGQLGFKQNLTAGEIVEQVLNFVRFLKKEEGTITNVVIMGMGEPFLNYDNTLKSISILNDPIGFNMGMRRFTISTVGIIPGIERFTRENSQVNLAISLHAANDQLRQSLIPIAKTYPLDQLFIACNKYIDATRRRLTFEWALIQGINDCPEDANELASKIKHMLCHVNLIPLNPTMRYDCQPSSHERVEAFKAILDSQGIPCSIRIRRGVDIAAGCGQLAAKSGH
jgi:23S rRNA (adenine2503-C2)-methyltransferase